MKPPLPIPEFPPDALASGLRRSRRLTHHASRITPHASRSRFLAFTLVEILVTVALLSFIILGLFAMFNQVQRAFRTSMNQVDQLGAGRAVTELIPRELEQMVPSGSFAVNFFTQILNSRPLTQSLPGTPIVRTNLLADCFILLRQNQNWVGIGYCVRTNDANGRLWFPEVQPGNPGQMGAGTLYRYQATLPVIYPHGDPLGRSGLPVDPSQLFTAFLAAATNGGLASLNISNRICDGVVHFRFRAFNTNGMLMTLPLRAGTLIQYSAVARGEIGLYRFASNTVPASVEMELGILEDHAWQRYQSMGAPAARLNYLQSTNYYVSSRVQLFRQRIPIRNVDPSAYQ